MRRRIHHAAFDNGATEEKTATNEHPANDPRAHLICRLIATEISSACPRRRGEAGEKSPSVLPRLPVRFQDQGTLASVYSMTSNGASKRTLATKNTPVL